MEEGEDEVELVNKVEVNIKKRRLQTCPHSIHALIKSKCFLPLFDHAVVQMRNLRFWGSRFVAFHLSNILFNNKPLPEINKDYIRRILVCIADGNNTSPDLELQQSVSQWKLATKNVSSAFNPNIAGLNTITTSTTEEYFTSFKNYQLYGLQMHWSYLVYLQNDISKKYARAVVATIMKELDLSTMESIDTLDDLSDIKASILENLTTLKDNLKQEVILNLKSLKNLTIWHYQILQKIQSLDCGFEIKQFSIAPLASGSLPFIEVCKKSMEDLLCFVVSPNSNGLFNKTLKSKIIWEYFDFKDAKLPNRKKVLELFKSINLYEIFKIPQRLNWEHSPTFKTDGHRLHCIWQCSVNLTKKITLKDFEERRATREINEMKWEEELTRVNNLNKNNMIKWESEQLPKIKWKTLKKRYQTLLDTHSDAISSIEVENKLDELRR